MRGTRSQISDSTHNGEIEMLIEKFGVASFKIFMFYGSHGLHGASDSQREFLMIGEGERYDYAHFEFVMRAIQAAREKMPDRASQISRTTAPWHRKCSISTSSTS